MGRLSARLAVQAVIQTANIPYVGTVYSARPTIIQEEDYEQSLLGEATTLSQNGSSTVVVINLPGKDKRVRRADVGRGAVNDTNIIPVVLELFFSSVAGDAVAAQLDYDTVVDALVVLVRNNPTMGTLDAGAVWSAGEFTEGVTHSQSEPFSTDDGLTVLIVGQVAFDVYQWISGTGV